jgi:hypothetical protein
MAEHLLMLEQCSTSELHVGILTAPPLLFCLIYLGGKNTAGEKNVFLGPNLINNVDIREASVFDKKSWEKFFHKLIWVTFCVWIKAVDGVTNIMEKNKH